MKAHLAPLLALVLVVCTIFICLAAPAVVIGSAEVESSQGIRTESRSDVFYRAADEKMADLKETSFGKMLAYPRMLADRVYGAPDNISVVAALDEKCLFENWHAGFPVRVVNRTNQAAKIRACDTRISLVCEALDPSGQWKRIGTLPRSTCGNSYMDIYLPGNSYWEFATPRTSGDFSTKMRFVLNGDTAIYSNEFEGSINLKQFEPTPEEKALNFSHGEEL